MRRILCVCLVAGAAGIVFAAGNTSGTQAVPDAPTAPVENRFEKNIQAFEDADRASPPPENAVLFVGSSSIRMWDVKKWFPDLPAINRGFGGSTTGEVNLFLDRIVLPYAPRTIVYYAGDNDIAGKIPAKTVAANFREFVRRVHEKLPETKIIYVAIKPSPSRWQFAEQTRAANGLVMDFCTSDQRLTYLDVFTPMLGENGEPRRELFLDDMLHLNDEGYRLWTSLLKPLL